jgi:pyruvate dehydrogenase E2 component (dihydrolipoyllysine-residue acetyltransferase)
MVTEFKLPELGEDIESGDVTKILVSVGDTVTQDQPVMEIETDKAAIEIPAPVGGVVNGIHVKEGQKVKIGQLLLSIDEGAEEKREGALVSKVKEEKRVEDQREEREEKKKEEKEVAKTTAKKEKGKPKEETEERLIEEKRAEIEEQGYEMEPKKESVVTGGEVVEFSRKPKTAVESETHSKLAPASPSVRRLAREIGIDINQVPGSGPGGRISEEDVKHYARQLVSKPAILIPDSQPAEIASLPDFAQWGGIERKPMTNVRRKTAQHLSYAWTAPHVTQHDKADITNLEKLRKDFGKKAEEAGGKLTVTAIILKVVASALKIFPQFNVSVDMANSEIIYKKYYHIGVAVDTDRGLLVPVIRDVDMKNILELSVELSQISEKARNKKIKLEEMKGSTFTITNLGGIGGTFFTPILNFPEVAILGVSSSKTEPVFVDGQFEPRLMLPISLSYDHRVIDGADGARFIRWIVEALEQPFRLILEG